MVPADIFYSEEHIWVKKEGNNVKMGLTSYGQEELGDVVFLDLPAVGQKIIAKTAMASIESVKAISDLIAPITGEVMEVNDELQYSPELVNQDPFGRGWIAVIEPADESGVEELLSAQQYAGFIAD